MPTYTIAANSIGEPVFAPAGSLVTVTPASGTAIVESTTSNGPAVANGVATYRSWSKGAVSAATADLWNEDGYIRVTAGAGAVTLAIDPSPPSAALDSYRRDWGGSRMSPTILAQSAVAVSVTGTLTETTLATITIPGGIMGANGSVRITPLFSHTNSANTKTLRVKFGGTTYMSNTPTASVATQQIVIVRNRTAATQVAMSATASLGASGSALVTSTVDSSADVSVVITGQLTNTGETITLEGYTVEVLPA